MKFAIALLLSAASAFETFEGQPISERLLQTRFATDGQLDEVDMEEINSLATADGWNAAKSADDDQELVALQGIPMSDALMQTRFAAGLNDVEIVDSESYAQVSTHIEVELPTCDRFLTVNCQPVCAEGLTVGCTEARSPTGYTDQIRSPDPYRYQGGGYGTNAKSTIS